MFLINQKTAKLILIILALLLNLVLRLPSVPHEIGWDTFLIHTLAYSVSEYGYAEWWLNSLSIFGFYPFSYASAVPFLISGMHQLVVIDLEYIVLAFSVLSGIFSFFTAYILATKINPQFTYKYLVALIYSTSPGILNFSTWQLSSRGIFIILLPIFVFLLLKLNDLNFSTRKFNISFNNLIKYFVCIFLLFVFLMASHHLFYFLFILIFAYVASKIIYSSHFISNLSSNQVSVILYILLICFFMTPFFTGLFIRFGRYEWLITSLIIYLRNAGIILLFAFSGLIYLFSKKYKSSNEVFLILSILCLTPLVYNQTYSIWFNLVFICVLAGFGLYNIVLSKPRMYLLLLIILLISFVSFSGFYQHWRTDYDSISGSSERYMEEGTFEAGKWMSIYMNSSSDAFVSNNPTIARRLFAVSGIAFLTGDSPTDLTYGLIDVNNVTITQNSPFSFAFYEDNPYVIAPGSGYADFEVSQLNSVSYDSRWGETIISKYNLTHVAEFRGNYANTLIRSLQEDKNSIYSNGLITVHTLN